MKFLFDASSMVHVIKNCEEEKALRLLNDSCVLDLTKYEVGNALWKEHVLHKAIGEKSSRSFSTCFETSSYGQRLCLSKLTTYPRSPKLLRRNE